MLLEPIPASPPLTTLEKRQITEIIQLLGAANPPAGEGER